MCLRSKLASSVTLRIPMIARQMKVNRNVESLIKQRVDFLGGFAYGAFNGAAQIKPWSLLRMVEASRAVVFGPSETANAFLDANQLYKNNFFFILASSLTVRKEFYDNDLVKAPVAITVELEHIGTTSFVIKSSAFVNGIRDPVFVSSVTSVIVCKETRRPKPPPPWWFEKFSKELPAGAKSIERFSLNGKDDCKSTQSSVTVYASDVDGYLHTNWASYVKYCYNAFVEHCRAKADSECHEDIFREVSDISTVYKRESSIGDLLTTSVYPHQNDPDIFFFNITKNNTVACECKLGYHPL